MKVVFYREKLSIVTTGRTPFYSTSIHKTIKANCMLCARRKSLWAEKSKIVSLLGTSTINALWIENTEYAQRDIARHVLRHSYSIDDGHLISQRQNLYIVPKPAGSWGLGKLMKVGCTWVLFAVCPLSLMIFAARAKECWGTMYSLWLSLRVKT